MLSPAVFIDFSLSPAAKLSVLVYLWRSRVSPVPLCKPAPLTLQGVRRETWWRFLDRQVWAGCETEQSGNLQRKDLLPALYFHKHDDGKNIRPSPPKLFLLRGRVLMEFPLVSRCHPRPAFSLAPEVTRQHLLVVAGIWVLNALLVNILSCAVFNDKNVLWA